MTGSNVKSSGISRVPYNLVVKFGCQVAGREAIHTALHIPVRESTASEPWQLGHSHHKCYTRSSRASNATNEVVSSSFSLSQGNMRCKLTLVISATRNSIYDVRTVSIRCLLYKSCKWSNMSYQNSHLRVKVQPRRLKSPHPHVKAARCSRTIPLSCKDQPFLPLTVVREFNLTVPPTPAPYPASQPLYIHDWKMTTAT